MNNAKKQMPQITALVKKATSSVHVQIAIPRKPGPTIKAVLMLPCYRVRKLSLQIIIKKANISDLITALLLRAVNTLD
jgi:hypothetical protein